METGRTVDQSRTVAGLRNYDVSTTSGRRHRRCHDQKDELRRTLSHKVNIAERYVVAEIASVTRLTSSAILVSENK